MQDLNPHYAAAIVTAARDGRIVRERTFPDFGLDGYGLPTAQGTVSVPCMPA
jgi:hypothetical protein